MHSALDAQVTLPLPIVLPTQTFCRHMPRFGFVEASKFPSASVTMQRLADGHEIALRSPQSCDRIQALLPAVGFTERNTPPKSPQNPSAKQRRRDGHETPTSSPPGSTSARLQDPLRVGWVELRTPPL
jgi:hypothetical protein